MLYFPTIWYYWKILPFIGKKILFSIKNQVRDDDVEVAMALYVEVGTFVGENRWCLLVIYKRYP